MLHPETLEAYRRMTPSERLRIVLDMIRVNTPYLFVGSPEQIQRKFELIRSRNDEGNLRILKALSVSENHNE